MFTVNPRLSAAALFQNSNFLVRRLIERGAYLRAALIQKNNFKTNPFFLFLQKDIKHKALQNINNFEKMAGTQPVNFSMYYKIEFCTNIRGHHVYQTGWTPEIEERLIFLKDNRSEAMEYDKYAIDVYKRVDKPDEKPKLVGHVPIECSSLLDYFLNVTAVTGKRMREIGLVVPGKFKCLTKKFRLADILHDELAKKQNKYSHFELEQIEFDKKRWPYIGLL